MLNSEPAWADDKKTEDGKSFSSYFCYGGLPDFPLICKPLGCCIFIVYD